MAEEALRFFKTYEVWVYLLLGFGALLFIRRFLQAWAELRGAGFGLEREKAQARLNSAASVLVLLLLMAVVEFVLVSFVAPTMPAPLLTPTLDPLATPTITLPAFDPLAGTALPGAGPTADATALPGTPDPAGQPPGTPAAEGCIPDQVFIASPTAGQEIGGTVPISGTVNVVNFGFYKIEMRRTDEQTWRTILAGDQPQTASQLGVLNTILFTPGDYLLGLVVVDNQGNSMPACTVNVRVVEPTPQP
jgi:hypothetical protein